MMMLVMFMMAMIIMVVVVMRVYVPMLDTRTEVLEHLLKEETDQHEQPDQFHLLVLAIKLRKNMYYRDPKQVRSGKDQQQLEILRTKIPDGINKKSRSEGCKKKNGQFQKHV